MVQRVVIPYAPRDAFAPFHDRDERFGAIVAHRRAGKTVAAINELIKAALTCSKPNPRFAYIAPFFARAKDVAWSYVKQYTSVIPGVEVNEIALLSFAPEAKLLPEPQQSEARTPSPGPATPTQ